MVSRERERGIETEIRPLKVTKSYTTHKQTDKEITKNLKVL